MSKEKHAYWMKQALGLAEKGRYKVSPNPMVGAVLVKGNRLISKGYHSQFGGAHAEAAAIKKAGKKAKGATLFVTLEPCSSFGKTPPCVEAILDAGIKQVVIASIDPNPLHNRKGIRRLRNRGIEVLTGVLKEEADQLNASFFKWIKTGIPYVTVKMAQSVDGKIATAAGESKWISSTQSRDWVHLLRAQQDAVLVGKNTLMEDDPSLSPRKWASKTTADKPWRIVIDPDFKVSKKARIFSGKQMTMIAVSRQNIKKIEARKRSKKSVVLLAVREKSGRLDLRDLLKQLGKLGVTKVLVEGGGELVWSLFEAKLVDRYLAFISPKILGGREAKTAVEGLGVKSPAQGYQFKKSNLYSFGDDWLFEGEN